MQMYTREVLELFVQTVDELRGTRFVRDASERGMNVTMTFTPDSVDIESTAPDGEAVRSLLLTFRLFLHNNDRISVGSLAKFTSQRDLSQEWKEWITALRDAVNGLLDSNSSLVINTTPLTNRVILETFIYARAHTNREKIATLKAWRSASPEFYRLIEHRFFTNLANLLELIFQMAEVTRLELRGEPIPTLARPTASAPAPADPDGAGSAVSTEDGGR
jgi:hypothetical protein